jgi:lysyl-tRNA synthetase class 2
MIEFYQAYATYHDVMDLTENLFRGIAVDVCGNAVVQYQGDEFDFSKTLKLNHSKFWIVASR